MEQALWNFIKNSRKNKPYISPDMQQTNMIALLNGMDTKTIESLWVEWRNKVHALKTPEFDKLHISNGGVVNGGDDAFYMDFANWFLGQGEDLFNKFLRYGHKHVLKYIEFYNIPHDELTYENLGYAFSTVTSMREKKSVVAAKVVPHAYPTLNEIKKILINSDGSFKISTLCHLDGSLLGYRIICRYYRESVNYRTPWSFDIPLDKNLSKVHRDFLKESAVLKTVLMEHNGLLISEQEFSTGVYAISLENNPDAVDLIISHLPQ